MWSMIVSCLSIFFHFFFLLLLLIVSTFIWTSLLAPQLLSLLFLLGSIFCFLSSFLSLTLHPPTPHFSPLSNFLGLPLQTMHVEVSVTFPKVPLSMVPLISVRVNGASASLRPPRACVMPSHFAAHSIALLPPSPGQRLTGRMGGKCGKVGEWDRLVWQNESEMTGSFRPWTVTLKGDERGSRLHFSSSNWAAIIREVSLLQPPTTPLSSSPCLSPSL